MKAIWFDLDGTLADLYGVDEWLRYLREENPYPYKIARPLVNMSALARILHRLQREGFTINVISWTSKDSSAQYHEEVTQAKLKWLAQHLKSVKFNTVDITEYGLPKSINRGGILFDDDVRNRKEWMTASTDNFAFDVHNILEVLRGIHSA